MPPRAVRLTIDQFCEARRVTRKTVENWRRETPPLPVRKEGGRILVDFADYAAWVEERAEAKAQRAAESARDGLDKDAEMARKLAAEASLAELKLATQRGELVPAQQFRDDLERVLGGFAAVALGQLQRFEREIVAAASPADARRLVERMQDALMHGAQAFADELEAEAVLTEDAEGAEAA